MEAYIHGSTDPREVARLEKQAKFCSAWWLTHVEIPAGARVLDLGTGIGAMASELFAHCPSAHITGLDRSSAQLAVARERHPVAQYVHGDAANMRLADQSFDCIHASWLLEHVPDPVAVAREAHRVLASSGVAYFLEVDNASLRTTPELPAVDELMRKLDAAQIAGGGDPNIGSRLSAIFEQAGFRDLTVTALPLLGDGTNPTFFRALAEEFAEIFESADEAMPSLHALIEQACQQMRALPELPGASMLYTPVMVRAAR